MCSYILLPSFLWSSRPGLDPRLENFAASPTNSQRLYAPSRRQHLRAGRRQRQMSLVCDSKPHLIDSVSASTSPLQQGHTTQQAGCVPPCPPCWPGVRAVNAPPPQLCADGGLYECMDTEEPSSSIVLMQTQQRHAHNRWPEDWTAAVYCQSVL